MVAKSAIHAAMQDLKNTKLLSVLNVGTQNARGFIWQLYCDASDGRPEGLKRGLGLGVGGKRLSRARAVTYGKYSGATYLEMSWVDVR